MPLTIVAPGVGGTGTTTGFNNFKNRIINGAMTIDQRRAGASTTINSGASTYTLDRWFASGTASAGVFTVIQSTSTPPASFSNFLRATVTTIDSSLAAGDFYGFSQRIEGFNIADLNWGSANAQTVTLSFWVRSSLTGTFTGALNATTASTASYVFSYTISAANTWEQKSVTVPGPTIGTFSSTSGIGLGLWFMLALGSTYIGSANAWTASAIYGVSGATNVMATLSATFDITGVQLEVGSTDTGFDFDRRPYGTELALCQRYYTKSYSAGVAPTATSSLGTPGGLASSGGNGTFSCTLKQTMRAAPTVTLYNPVSGAAGSWYDGGALSPTATASQIGDSGFLVDTTSGSANSNTYGHYVASAEL